MDSDSSFSRRLNRACQTVREQLLEERTSEGHWVGELSSSALATATSISALSQYLQHSSSPSIEPAQLRSLIERGKRWLLKHQNHDGGWGDTDQSHSNIATSMLVVAAFSLSEQCLVAQLSAENTANGSGDDTFVIKSASAIERAEAYIKNTGSISALRKRYGKDKTFAVPILANCAIAGIVPWKEVSALPFEAALVPQKCFRFVNLPVVSYAIPALVAIGQAKYFKDPPWNPVSRLLRKSAVKPGMNLLSKMQPGSGGFLEAIPLTSFVAMSLAHTGRADHQVTHNCIQFIVDSFRCQGNFGESKIGTWPIDTNLATWTTTLAINALAVEPSVPQTRSDDNTSNVNQTSANNCSEANEHLTEELLNWVLSCQYKTIHPFTGAAPGGWGWSDLSGAVPDADDTPGALLAIRQWIDSDRCSPGQADSIKAAARSGIDWLLALQNRDQGWPTFCRGWGRLPFDRSGNDLTAHVIRSLVAWQDIFNDPKIDAAIKSGFDYLKRHRRDQAGWLPLWFGNQDQAGEENPVYGTTKVLAAYREAGRLNNEEVGSAVLWLLENQNDDFGWGGGISNQVSRMQSLRDSGTGVLPRVISSVQETSLVLDILASLALPQPNNGSAKIPGIERDQIVAACKHGALFLVEAVEAGKTFEKWPIGFYFAKLWYYEKLYPLLFAAPALQRLRGLFCDDADLLPLKSDSQSKMSVSQRS